MKINIHYNAKGKFLENRQQALLGDAVETFAGYEEKFNAKVVLDFYPIGDTRGIVLVFMEHQDFILTTFLHNQHGNFFSFNYVGEYLSTIFKEAN